MTDIADAVRQEIITEESPTIEIPIAEESEIFKTHQIVQEIAVASVKETLAIITVMIKRIAECFLKNCVSWIFLL